MWNWNRDRDCEPTQLTVVARMGAFLSLAYRAQNPRLGRPEAGFCCWITRTNIGAPAFLSGLSEEQHATIKSAARTKLHPAASILNYGLLHHEAPYAAVVALLARA